VTFQNRVVVKNAKSTMKALKEFQPDAEKEIRKRINKAAGKVRDNARRMLPTGNALRNWGAWSSNTGGRDLTYDGNNKAIRLSRANSRARGQIISNYIGVINPTPAGSIFELAGRRNADASFMHAFGEKNYGDSRKTNTDRGGVFKAFDDDKGAAVREIEGSLKEAERLLQVYLNNTIGE